MRKLAYWTCSAAMAVGCVAFAGGPQKTGDAAKGKEVFEQCSVCHNSDSDEKKMGPGLKGLSKKAKMGNGKAPTDANIAAKVNEGGGGMPAYSDILTDQEKADLLAYLKTL